MLRWAPYPFVRVTLSLMAGILLYYIWGKDFSYIAEFLAFLVTAYIGAWAVSRKAKTAFATDMAGLLGLLCFMAGGFYISQLHTPAHNPDHFLHLPEKPAHYIGVVEDYIVQKPGYQNTVLRVLQVQVKGQWQHAIGKVQLSVPHDSDKEYELSYGDVLLIKGAPLEVAPPTNPNQFDYRKFLANKGIYHRHYLQPYQFQVVSTAPPNPVLAFSIYLRRQLDALLRERVSEKREYAISSALILGVKDELDNAIRSAYANTGTMHVLAVSGLHVGLLYVVLMWLLNRIDRSRRQRVLGAVLVLSFLWLYAFVTGLSPSVLRAVVMFNLVTVALAIKRQTNIYNTVAIAAAVLFMLNPYNLKEVGFQLSFLAVLGIVYLQPKLYRLLEVNNWLLDKIWALFTVAVAAQVATLPLGLFYFHQFPVYFWFANIVVVPAATLVLYTGMAALAFSWVPLLSEMLFKLHFGFIWVMNEFNLWVQQLPYTIINGIDISLLQTWLLYALFLLLILFMALRKLRYFAMATAVAAVLSVQEVLETMQQKEQELLAIYNVRGSTGLALVQGQQATVLADSLLLGDESNFTFNLQPHLWQMGIAAPVFASLADSLPDRAGAAYTMLPDSNSLLVWRGQRMLLLSRPPQLIAQKPLPLNYLLLRHNVRLRPQDFQHYEADKVILDASNSPWYRQRLRQQLDTLGIAYYDVADSGAFVLKLR